MSVNQPGYGSFVWTDPVGLTWLRLEAVIDPAEPAALWVADPSPRAQAFYRKHGFAADGTARSGDGVREIRMVRGVQHDGTGRSRREPSRSASACGPKCAARATGARRWRC